MDLISFPNAKINLGLNILSKREDGYHNIESCFLPVKWMDILEIIPIEDTTKFTASGIAIPGNPNDNLCLKAYYLLKEQFKLPPVHIHLHKIIPIGAGLGGGSADAAFTLKNLNDQFDLNLEDEALMSVARKLGSDCAFFIRNSPVLAKEKGDVFEDIDVDLKGKYIIIVHPGIHVSTIEAYAGVKAAIPEKRVREILLDSLDNWQKDLKNDFEFSVFKKYPEIKLIKDQLYNLGAIYSSMSGSGSAVFGLFNGDIQLPKFPSNYSVWNGVVG